MIPRMREHYEKQALPALKQEFGYANAMQIPKITKIVVNCGLGEALQNPKLIETTVEELGSITGQHPVITKAKKSIASFKLREGQNIGVAVTLRERTSASAGVLDAMAAPVGVLLRESKGAHA